MNDKEYKDQTVPYVTDKQILDETKEGLNHAKTIIEEVCPDYPTEEKQKFIVSLFIYLMPKLYNHPDGWRRDLDKKKKAGYTPY